MLLLFLVSGLILSGYELPQLKAPWKTPEMKHCWSHNLDRKQHSRWRWGKRESCGWFCLPGDCPQLHRFVNSWEQILSLTVEARQGSPMHCELNINNMIKSMVILINLEPHNELEISATKSTLFFLFFTCKYFTEIQFTK